jgi:hypothetical protein
VELYEEICLGDDSLLQGKLEECIRRYFH